MGMILTGLARLGRDAELRYTSSGEAVVNLALAFNYGQKQADGNRQTQWLEASLWGKRAEALAPHLAKGSALSVVLSEPHVETFEGKNGTGHKLVSRVIDIEFAGSKGESSAPAAKQDQKPAMPAPSAGSGFDDLENDLPF